MCEHKNTVTIFVTKTKKEMENTDLWEGARINATEI